MQQSRFDAFSRYDVYNLTLSKISSNLCLSFLAGSSLLKEDQLSLSISRSCLKEGIDLPIK